MACRFELAAAGGDVYAAPLADGAGDAVLDEDGLELFDGRMLGGLSIIAIGGVKGDEVDVGADGLQ